MGLEDSGKICPRSLSNIGQRSRGAMKKLTICHAERGEKQSTQRGERDQYGLAPSSQNRAAPQQWKKSAGAAVTPAGDKIEKLEEDESSRRVGGNDVVD